MQNAEPGQWAIENPPIEASVAFHEWLRQASMTDMEVAQRKVFLKIERIIKSDGDQFILQVTHTDDTYPCGNQGLPITFSFIVFIDGTQMKWFPGRYETPVGTTTHLINTSAASLYFCSQSREYDTYAVYTDQGVKVGGSIGLPRQAQFKRIAKDMLVTSGLELYNNGGYYDYLITPSGITNLEGLSLQTPCQGYKPSRGQN